MSDLLYPVNPVGAMGPTTFDKLLYIIAIASYGFVAIWCIHHAMRYPERRSPLVGVGLYLLSVAFRAGLAAVYPESIDWGWTLTHRSIIAGTALLSMGDLVFGKRVQAVIMASLLLLSAGCIQGSAPPLPTSRQPIYLPLVASEDCVTGAVSEMHQLLTKDSRQQHKVLICDRSLMAAAKAKALDMANRGYFAHQNPDGEWPNALARRHGCKLPGSYSDNANGIESLVAGVPPLAGWNALMTSKSHSDHLLGRNDYFRAQTHYGLASVVVPGSPYTYYQVYLIGVCE